MNPKIKPAGARRTLRAAFPVTVPVMTGYLCLGLAYGILMKAQNYGVLWAALMSMVGYCGSMQFVALTLLVTAYNPFQALLLSVMVNARHMFYGLALLDKYRGMGWAKFPLVYLLTDETFSIISTVAPPPDLQPRDFYLCISLLDYSYWLTGTVMGNLLGGILPFDTTGMDFALTALFVVLFMEQWKKAENRPAGIIGLVCTALSLLIFGDNLVIPAMILILAVLLGGRKHLCT